MKKIFTLFTACLLSSIAFSQLTITENQTATDLANALVATSGTLGITVSNASLTCDSTANGFITGNSNIGISNGIVLSSGRVATDLTSSQFGLDGLPTDMASNMIGTPGDVTLGAIVTAPTYDACVLEFDLTPVGNFVEFEYVFGSEEYPEFNCTAFNDIFGFFISGPGISTPTNIALVPSTSLPVSINSINDGTGGGCSTNTNLYVTNNDTTNTMDGFTVPLIATTSVTSGQTYHLKLAIADVADGILNSYVVLKANSLKSGNNTPSSVNAISSAEAGIEIYPTEVDQMLNIKNSNLKEWNIEVINLDGRICYRNTIVKNQPNISLNLRSLSKGVYILRLNNSIDGQNVVEKFIKN
jgi:hypothetical protein